MKKNVIISPLVYKQTFDKSQWGDESGRSFFTGDYTKELLRQSFSHSLWYNPFLLSAPFISIKGLTNEELHVTVQEQSRGRRDYKACYENESKYSNKHNFPKKRKRFTDDILYLSAFKSSDKSLYRNNRLWLDMCLSSFLRLIDLGNKNRCSLINIERKGLWKDLPVLNL